MARKFVVSLDLNKNELINARIQNLSTAPSNPVSGQIYYDTVANILYFWNGAEWISTSGSLEVIQDAIGTYVSGGTGLTSTYNDTTGVTTIDLDNTTVNVGSYGTTAAKTASFTVDAQGRLTSASEQDIQIATSQVTNLEEFIDDTVGDSVAGLIKEGEGIDVVYDDTAGTLTISAEDASSSNKGIASFDSTDFTVNTGNVTLNAERVEDIVANLVVGGTGIDVTYTDGSGTLSIDIDSTVTTNDGSQTLTNKTIGTGTALGANLNAANFKVTGLATPTEATDAATKGYVDAVAEGLHVHASVVAATTGNIDLTTGGLLTVDGVELVAGDRVLVRAQTNLAENGIYTAAEGTWARAADYNTAGEIQAGDFVFVSGGSTYNSTGWVQENVVIVLGTDPIVWDQFSGAGTYTAGAGITLSGTEFSVDVTPISGNASLINTGGAVEVKTDISRGLSVDANGLGINAGTGLTFTENALSFASGYGVRKASFDIGNGSATTFTINHNFATRDLTVQIYENASPFAQVEADVEHTDSNNVTVKFAVAPSSAEYRAVIIG